MNIAVLLPCYNEEKTITKVIRDFKSNLPAAEIIVFDNNSTDNSAELARKESVQVIPVKIQGKGYVVRKMFEVIDADVYVLVDCDDTYFAEDVQQLIRPILEDKADMVIGRRTLASGSAMKKINRLGNLLFSNALNFCFMRNIHDVLSGYRAMNRRLVENTPILTHEFQVEMEMTIQALYRKMRVIEVPVKYKERPDESFSKLHPLKDGGLILLTLLALVRDLRPLALFGFVSFLLMIGVVCYGIFIYLMPREAKLLDTIVIISFSIISFLFLSMGLFLHTINRRFVELYTLLKRKGRNADIRSD